MEVYFQVSENVVPVFKANRKVLFMAIETVDEELDRLKKSEVIKKVDYLKWAALMVCIKKKNNKIRLCANFSTGLNNCLKTYHHPLLTAEETFSKLNGGKFFSKLDLSEAYLQIKVNEKCSKYLTINTHRELYRYTRLPFGLKMASAIFQQIMDTLLANCEFAIPYLDDILTKSNSHEQHVEHIKAVFEKIKVFGFTLSEEKCKFSLPQIKYLGQIIGKSGRCPDSLRAKLLPKLHS
eukprot:XP_014786948.1 PREDICTED: uncharacterized protein K02A2.6-like [Octopus bimaculoides]